MKFLEDISQVLELILLLLAIADSQKTMIAAAMAIAIYGIIKLIKAKKNQ